MNERQKKGHETLAGLAALIIEENLLQHAPGVLAEYVVLSKEEEACYLVRELMRTCRRDQLRAVAYLFSEFLPPLDSERLAELTTERLWMHLRLGDLRGFYRARVAAFAQERHGILPADYRLPPRKRSQSERR